MTDESSDQSWLPSDTPHAVEVRDAQAAADVIGNGGRPASPPGVDAAADLELLRGLLAAYGADGVRRMIDSLM
jgi:hypothetical protein